MNTWLSHLQYDPLPSLLGSDSVALTLAVRRDLLGEQTASPQTLWDLKDVRRLLSRQEPDGSWRYPGGGKERQRSVEDYTQLETYRSLGVLVEKYGATRELPEMESAAEFLFSRQTDAGDFRGIYGNQYTPNYSAAILELLVKAGYDEDERILRSFAWLLSMRQADGGWALPVSTVGARWDVATLGGPTLEPDCAKPFSHMVTGVVLRPFAAHPVYRKSPDAGAAGRLLASRLFKRDSYPGRNTPEFWMKFCYPFWFTDLLSALDSLSWLGFGPQDENIRRGLEWLAEKQQPDGGWRLYLLHTGKDPYAHLWVGLAICRVFKRMFVYSSGFQA